MLLLSNKHNFALLVNDRPFLITNGFMGPKSWLYYDRHSLFRLAPITGSYRWLTCVYVWSGRRFHSGSYLILVFNLLPQNAIVISLVAMCGTTISASLGYIKQKRVDYKLALLYDILDIPGVIVGAYLTTILPKNLLIGICDFLFFLCLCLF